MDIHLSPNAIEKLYKYADDAEKYYNKFELEILEEVDRRLSQNPELDEEDIENEILDRSKGIQQPETNEECEEYIEHMHTCVICRIRYTIYTVKSSLKIIKKDIE